MWNYICYCQVFFLIANAVLQQKADVEIKPNHEVESAFADVIRNISRVNNVLQELINNYERLQKIYKSQENLDSEYSSDTEIDEVFKSVSKKKKKEVQSKQLTSTTQKSSDDSFQPATQIIWSDIDKPDNVAKKTQHDKENKTKGKVPHVQHLQAVKPTKVKSKSSFEFSSATDSNENVIQESTKNKVVPSVNNKKLSKNQHNNQSIQVEMKFVGYTETPKNRYYKIQPNYPIGYVKNKPKVQVEPRLYLRQGNSTDSAGLVQRAKTYSTKLMKDKLKYNITIKSQSKQKEPFYRTKNDKKQKTSDKNKTRKKTALILVKNGALDSQISKENSSVEDEQAINKEVFKTNVLRQAYGDACLKLVVKKCFKACKSASKQSCREYKCNSEFKSKFIQHSKTGCIKEFKKVPDDERSSKYTRQFNFKNTRTDGYFDAACSEDFKTDPIMLRNATPSALIKADNGPANLNILRGKLEKACKKISQTKCQDACKYAIRETCDSYKCSKGHVRKFHKYCKSECKAAYTGRSSFTKSDKKSKYSSGTSGSSGSGSFSDDSETDSDSSS